MVRDRIALVLLGAFAVIWLGYAWRFSAWSLRAASVPVTFAAVYVVVAVGLATRQPSARWIGVGLAASGLVLSILLARIGFSWGIELGMLALAPMPLFVLLPVRDETPRRARLSWLFAGSMLLPLIFIAYDATYAVIDHGNASPFAIVAAVLALGGIGGLARARTWGLLATSLAGAILFFAMPSAPVSDGVVMLNTREVMRGVAVGLVCVCLPFAGPIWRHLRQAD